MDIRPELAPGTSGVCISDLVFLKETLKAIRKRRGLIHGKFKNGGVCALGALDEALRKVHKQMSINSVSALELQGVNDSIPKGTKAERRAKVIQWLQERIKKLEADAA